MRQLLVITALVTTQLSAVAGTVGITVKSNKGAPLEDAVVSLVRLDTPPATPVAPAAPVIVSQQNQEYLPYVTPVLVGTTVEFPNNDTVQHHIYSVAKAKRFEKPLYAPGAHETVTFDQVGVVTLGCNIHDWMAAYIIVLATPHFAKSDASGLARIADIPAGRYRLEIWHPRLSSGFAQDMVVTSAQDSAQEITLPLKADRRIRRAPEGKTGGY